MPGDEAGHSIDFENAAMGVNTNVHQVLAAVSVLERARDVCSNLKPMSCPMTDLELHQRAAVIEKVISARCKLQQLRNRAEALECALERFKTRREALRA
jgi:hypothetical protein